MRGPVRQIECNKSAAEDYFLDTLDAMTGRLREILDEAPR